ncbi:MAG: N-glycosylase/DNA lyase [Candidatus Hermodarchaeota archaeon]
MRELLDTVNGLKESEISQEVKNRIDEFFKFKNKSMTEIFRELCFCILTANCNAEKCIEVQEMVGNGFHELDESSLSQQLKNLGYRFPNIRAKYIIEARDFQEQLFEKINSVPDLIEMREWLVKNIKGLGYKEASHFLRNIGFFELAIIDFHILDLLIRFSIIEKPKSLSKTRYLEIEKILKEIAKELNLNLAELDLYMWYMETGKILK